MVIMFIFMEYPKYAIFSEKQPLTSFFRFSAIRRQNSVCNSLINQVIHLDVSRKQQQFRPPL